MKMEIRLYSTLENLLDTVLVLPNDALSLLSRPENQKLLFRDLLDLGCDFFDLFRLFVKCDHIDLCLCELIIEEMNSLPRIERVSLNNLREIIPHWTGSKYHTGSINNVLQDVREKIAASRYGGYIYNSNLNVNNPRAYNDLYALLISEEKKMFIDVNRRKIYEFL